ncbi:MAG: YbaB/EbfC family nucleoid-associated protein [Alphaproteobacteria bacterium]|jgi:DNA-binding YbaB/EbfC family protein|nr:YbaB/EbfC family nucleoid-associated protein [Alphaproteobacteria bacterium]OJU58584.1 MAG: nucleoid-associated protein, YbaB/EbfC family [Alphaproteobacteria bacterium 62-8]MBN9559008.1 YbaB/EbfC family nucleoid-associated protein [Alphaproteobacteria bacterium]MBN9568850.1 YbaB/EbfC family nucleoid-associated protein [Alphaproteobacteria bacterium]MBN9577377.1 YbaB/EbfC family nucleoid-associated protein [Alphaproteobacteria bacterium]
MNLTDLFKQAKDMQARAEEMQKAMAAIDVVGESGAGMVRVTLTGKSELKALAIDPSLLKPEDKTVIEDLIVAAHNDARAKLEARMAEEMQRMSREMGLPAGLGGLFGQ